jgi:hypothetical protein
MRVAPRLKESPRTLFGVRCQAGRPFERARGSRMTATIACVPRGALQGDRHLFVFAVCGGSKVPRTLAGKNIAGQRVRKGTVRRAPGRRRRTVVHRSSHQGMPELNPNAVVSDQTGSFCVLESPVADTHISASKPHLCDRSRPRGGRHKQGSLRLLGKIGHPACKESLDAQPYWQGFIERLPPLELGRRHQAGDLDDRKGVPCSRE